MKPKKKTGSKSSGPVKKSPARVKNVAKKTRITVLIGHYATQYNGWRHGKIISADNEHTTVHLFDFKQEVTLPSADVIPRLPPATHQTTLRQHQITADHQGGLRGAFRR